jgi:phosphatidylserine/phosphatidylglycerophosphate/cardiolipin synthase-like enzyme
MLQLIFMNPLFFTSSHTAWDAMLTMIASAQKTIDIEQYIFENDEIGHEFLTALIEKAKAGVRVAMVLDTVGSYYFYASGIAEQMRAVGIEIRFFNVVSPWRLHYLFSFFFRTHRKILVVDGTQALIGGVGIRNDMKHWRDTSVLVTGAIVKEIATTFNEMWSLAQSKNIWKRLKKITKQKKHLVFLTNAPTLAGEKFIALALNNSLLRVPPLRLPHRTLFQTYA